MNATLPGLPGGPTGVLDLIRQNQQLRSAVRVLESENAALRNRIADQDSSRRIVVIEPTNEILGPGEKASGEGTTGQLIETAHPRKLGDAPRDITIRNVTEAVSRALYMIYISHQESDQETDRGDPLQRNVYELWGAISMMSRMGIPSHYYKGLLTLSHALQDHLSGRRNSLLEPRNANGGSVPPTNEGLRRAELVAAVELMWQASKRSPPALTLDQVCGKLVVDLKTHVNDGLLKRAFGPGYEKTLPGALKKWREDFNMKIDNPDRPKWLSDKVAAHMAFHERIRADHQTGEQLEQAYRVYLELIIMGLKTSAC